MSYGAPVYAGPTPAAGGAAGTFPALAFEVAFASSPGSADPIWTDVTSRLRSASVTRGRQRELDRFQAGRASFVLNNRDRLLDPTYASGSYYGQVTPMKRVRLRATYAGVTYPVFDGFIDSWDQQYVQPREAVAVVNATDGFKVLAAIDLPTSAYAREVLADSPVGWWRLGEPDTTTLAYDAVGDRDLTRTGTGVAFGQTSLISRESDTAASIIITGGVPRDGLSAYVSAPVATPPMSVELVFQETGPGAAEAWLFGQASGFLGFGAGLQVTVGGQAKFVFAASTLINGSITGTTDIRNGTVHHIVGVWESDGTVRLYVDGVQEASAVGVTPTAFPSQAYVIIGGADLGTGIDGVDGVYDEAVLYSSALSASRIAAHAAAVTTPWNGDAPGTRLGRILDFVAWPSALREIDTGSSVLQSATLAVSALEHAEKVAESEFGELYVTRDGTVRFESRTALINQPNYGTFGDGAMELDYAGIEFDYSDQLIRNEVTVSRNEGIAQTQTDAASVAAYLRHSYTRDGLIHNSDTLSRGAAQFLVTQYKDPLLRVTRLEVAPRRDPSTLFPQVLGRELTDKITAVRRPQGVGSAISQDSVIEGIEHHLDVSRQDWRTSWQLSPAYSGCFFELDDGSGSVPCGLGSTDSDGPSLYF